MLFYSFMQICQKIVCVVSELDFFYYEINDFLAAVTQYFKLIEYYEVFFNIFAM